MSLGPTAGRSQAIGALKGASTAEKTEHEPAAGRSQAIGALKGASTAEKTKPADG